MRINFRQGLVRVPTNFLSLAAGKVSLNISSAETLVAVFADGTNDYLITERISVSNAWTGPFTGGTDYWLYIDINTLTGARTFGHTTLSPYETAVAPANPLVGQHWFDTSTTTMKVWTGASWLRKVRVFVAELSAGTTFISMSINANMSDFTGTQIGSLDGINVSAGSLVFDASNGTPIKKSDGTFFTTEDLAVTGVASSSHVKMGSIVIEAEAQANIPDYSIVRFVDFNKIEVATNYTIDNGAYGIVDYGVISGNVANVTLEGLIENINWDWSAAGVNAPLYVDSFGQLTTVVPPTPIIVAAVVDVHTILLRPSSLFLNNTNDPMTSINPGTARLSIAAVDPTDPIVVGDNDPRISSVNPHINDTTIHLSSTQNTFLDTLVGYSGGIVAMDNSNNGVTRSLVQPSAGFTITDPAGVAGNPTFILSNDLAAVEGLAATGLAARTATDTWATRSIVAPTEGITITNPDAVAGNPTLVLANDLGAVEGLVTTGLTVRTATDTWDTRSIVAPAEGISITNPDAVAGNPTLVLANDLSAIESLTSTGLAARIAADTWTTRSIVAPAEGITITDADAILGNPTMVLTNDLGAVEGLITNGFAVRTATDTWTTRSITAASGETSITNTDGIAGNVVVGLPDVGTPIVDSFKKITTDAKGRVSGSSAVTASDINTALTYTPVNKAGDTMTGALILSADPILPLGAATKQYVDNLSSGLDPKGSVKVATTAPITLSLNQTIDDVAVVTGDRVLVKNQVDATTNGVYEVVNGGAWTRSIDCIPGTSMNAGAFFFVEQGTLYAESGWVLTADNPITGATNLVFQQFSGAGQITAGAGLFKNGNTLSVITPTAGNITINGSGIDLTATAVVAGTYKSVTVDAYGRITDGTNPTTLSGYGISDAQPLDADLTEISAFASTGLAARNTNGTWSQRAIVGSTNQVVVTNGNGDGANPTISLDSNYVQFPGTNGMFVPAGTTLQAVTTINGGLRYDTVTNKMSMVENSAWVDVGTIRSVSYTNPVAGILLSGVLTGSNLNITTTLGEDLQALEALNSTGIAVRTGTNAWAQRQVAGTAGRIVVANGDGIVGNPTVDLVASGVGAGTYTKTTVDIYGRVISGIVAGTAGATTLADYGLADDAQPLSTNLTALSSYNTNGIICQTSAGTFAGRSVATGAGITTTNLTIGEPTGTAGNITLTFSGDLNGFLTAQSSTGFPVRTAANTWAQRQISGTADRITITNPAGVAGDPTVNIAATYAGQNTISTVGTVTTGTWSADPIAVTKGGTGISSNGTIDQFVSVSHTNAAVWEYKTLNGTANQVVVTHVAGTTTLSTPQDIGTTSNVAFNSVNAPIVKSAILTLTDAANIAWDMNLGIHAEVTLAASRTLDNPTNQQAGSVVILIVKQDGTGSYTLSYGTAYKWTGGTPPVVAAGPNQVSVFSFICDGTSLYEISRSLNVA